MHPKFVKQVGDWISSCFGETLAKDKKERTLRFLEESLELCQALGMEESVAHEMVKYVFSRPAGDMRQEAGGVMITLAGLARATKINLDEVGTDEYIRCMTNTNKIREKHNQKPKGLSREI